MASTPAGHPTTGEWAELCKKVRDLMPDPVGKDAWYILIATVLSSSPRPHLLADFYTYLTAHDTGFVSAESKARLSVRLRDVLLKLVTLVGAPQVLSALIPLAKVEGDPEAKAKDSELSEKWKNVDVSSIYARGVATIDTIYGRLLPKIFASFGSHSQDIQFMELFTVYGMYLSDFDVMDAIETEVVVSTAITCTGLRGPSLWHVRGLGRLLGARGTDERTKEMIRIKDWLRNIKVATVTCVEFCGDEMVRRSRLDGGEDGRGWPNVGDVVRELGGWGDDPFPSTELKENK